MRDREYRHHFAQRKNPISEEKNKEMDQQNVEARGQGAGGHAVTATTATSMNTKHLHIPRSIKLEKLHMHFG